MMLSFSVVSDDIIYSNWDEKRIFLMKFTVGSVSKPNTVEIQYKIVFFF